MDIKGVAHDEFNEWYFGMGLDSGLSLDQFKALIVEELDHWTEETREEFKDDPDGLPE